MPARNTQYSLRNTLPLLRCKVLLLAFLFLHSLATQSQTLPVGTPILEDYYRRLQLLGELDSNISFTVRPLTAEALSVRDIFNPDTTDSISRNSGGPISFANGKGKFQVLPIMLQTQYNTKRPYGWNDGPMIPARGFQSLVSAGVYAKYGPLSVQLRPEFVYAENRKHSFDAYPGLPDGYIDLPDRFGDKAYKKLFPGQSSVRLNFKNLSFGISSENLWWGPGIQNSLLMSNTAPGFYHWTLNTIKPVRTKIGSFEGQLIGGRLEGSGFTNKPKDWRYLSGMTFNYQPRWVPGLFLGITRSLQAYNKDLNGLSDYVPIFSAFSSKSNGRPGETPSDQLFSVFTRWLWKETQAEVYFEYARGDHSANFRDYMLEPEHSRAYLFGFQKLVPLRKSREYIQLNFEAIHLQQSINYAIRTAGSWYHHAGGIIHGYTHKGQIIGAGIGPGSNSQSIHLQWLKDLKGFGLQFKRNIFYSDYSFDSFQEKFVDLSFGLNWMDNKGLITLQTILFKKNNSEPSAHSHVSNLRLQLNIFL